ncbi:DNA methylase [Arthrobacter sp. LS16]|nr:DNA methylase [Arthrobacter sp. LS16]
MSGRKQKLELSWYNKDKALIPNTTGKYGYSWVDPRDPRYCETHTLIFDDVISGSQKPEENSAIYSKGASLQPTTDNLLVLGESGDVLDALTRVPELADKYVGEVKCIYIDPPFNTAQTFEHYEDNLEHSVWLTMMRDRLVNMRHLLSADGSIWVHLDDNEVHRMRSVMDEVFGPGNFVAQVSWEKIAGRDNRAAMSKTCDFILVYERTKNGFKKTRNLLARENGGGAEYGNPDNDPRGVWTSDNFTAQYNPEENPRESQRYTLVTPSGRAIEPSAGNCWRFTKERYEELLADNRVYFGADGNNAPRLKRFLSEVQAGLVAKTLWTYDEVGTNDSAKKEIQSLFPGETPFSTPKPERLLERILHIASNPGEIVLDVFAGSGTTAAVAHKMGRRWVTAELVPATFNNFVLPRLRRVVDGSDPGGITSTDDKQYEHALKAFNKSVKEYPALKESEVAFAFRKELRKYRGKKTMNWRGGGSFTTAHLSPSCFDYDVDLELVTLTDAATDHATLTASVAAQLGFSLIPKHPYFHGEKGAMKLVVTVNPLTPAYVEEIVGHLAEGERVTIASPVVLDGTRKALREFSRGSRIIHVPDDLFSSARKDV